MAEKRKSGMTRRDLMKTLGLGLGLSTLPAGALAAPEAPAKTPLGPMPRRALGKTGLEVSILNLGGMFDTGNNQLLLKQALGWGINFWDTAEAYGNGQSEAGYGRFFGRNPEARKEIVLTTKLVPKGGDLTGRLEAALARLKTPYVDLFYIHAITDIGVLDGQMRDWAAAMKKAGKIKFFGFSSHNNMEACLTGAASLGFVDAAMIAYNYRLMHEPKMRSAMQAAKAAGIGVVAMKTQGGGPVKSDSQAELDLAGHFLERGFSDKQAKLKAVWADPDIASLCSQMPNLTILAANVAAARDAVRLSREDLHVLHRYAEATAGDYCAGCSSHCQAAMGGAVPVADFMRAMMYYRDYGERDLARELFASLPDSLRARLGDLDFAPAEAACPRGVPIAAIVGQAAGLLA